MPRPRQFFLLLALTAALFTSGCVSLLQPPPAVPVAMSAAERAAHNLRAFDHAWELVDKKFFDAKFRGVDWAAMRTQYRPEAMKAADDQVLYGTINSMLGELKESHNYAMTPQQRFEEHMHQRARVGIGQRLIDKRWVITDVVAGGPAESAGVRPGWVVLTRDGKPMEEQFGVALKEDQQVVYKFLDERDNPRVLTLTARVLSTAPQKESRELPDGIVYLRFDGFDASSLRWMSAQLKAHRAAPAVIVDLRHNSGGLFYSLEFTMGEFFTKPVSLGTFVRRSGSISEQGSLLLFSARYGGRVVLLTDRSTASCAEILTHAMRFHQRAIVVGRKTAGAVVVSRFYALPDGGELQLAIEDYRGLDGQRLEGVGLIPDVNVTLKLAEIRAGVDSDLEAALAELRKPVGVASNH